VARHLPDDQPVYAAQAPEARGDGASPGTVEEVAATYVEALRTIEPDGPYHLIGWSAGGVVAFEMARQLQAAGAPVGVVVLGDSAPPGQRPLDDSPPSVADLLRGRRGLRLAEVPAAAVSDARRLAHRLRAAARRAAPPVDVDVDVAARREEEANRWRRRVARSTHDLAVSYRPSPYAGHAVLLHCIGTDDAAIAAWRSLCHGGLEVHDIDAPHQHLFVEPALSAVGAIVARLLQTGAAVESTSRVP
jgi:thioesterase domain-containing protein